MTEESEGSQGQKTSNRPGLVFSSYGEFPVNSPSMFSIPCPVSPSPLEGVKRSRLALQYSTKGRVT
jgi:hypothetical protein